MADRSVVDKLEMQLKALDELCSSLSEAEWDAETECPGWSVKDNISHIIGTEHSILGNPPPQHDPGEKPWIKNPIGASNEIHVDYRRGRSGAEVLDELREVAAERLAAVKALSEDDLAAESWTPIGQGTVADLIAIRIMDMWVHEQDIRRAVGKPGNLEGPIAEHVVGRHATALPFVVGKKVGISEGTAVVFDVTGPAGREIAVTTDGKRAKQMDEVPTDPTVRLTMDLETFNRLCTGRGEVSEVASGVKIEGDEALGKRIVEQMNFMI